MTFKEAEKLITGIYIKSYGIQAGQQEASIMMPSLLEDFRHMLRAAEPFSRVEETYVSEDKLSVVKLVGQKTDSGIEILEVSEGTYEGE